MSYLLWYWIGQLAYSLIIGSLGVNWELWGIKLEARKIQETLIYRESGRWKTSNLVSFIQPSIFAPHWPLQAKVTFIWIVLLYLMTSFLLSLIHWFEVELFLFLLTLPATARKLTSPLHSLSCAFSTISFFGLSKV